MEDDDQLIVESKHMVLIVGVVCLVFGAIIGFMIADYNPFEQNAADYLEYLLKSDHPLRTGIVTQETPIYQIKDWYFGYGLVSRSLLEHTVHEVCSMNTEPKDYDIPDCFKKCEEMCYAQE